MREQTKLTKEQRERFCSEYLLAREQDMTRREAYLYAKRVLATEGIPAPAFNTLDAWIRYGLPKDSENVKKTADAESEEVGRNDTTADAESEEPEATEIAACGNEEEITQPENTDRTDLYLALLRLYRYRREEDIDAVVDLTVPELSGEVEA